MNSFTLLNLVLDPEKAKDADLEQLEELVEEHPYFQAGRLLIAKITKQSEHIKTAAAYTSERTVLMDVINSTFNKDVNLPNIDHMDIGSDDLELFNKLGKEEEQKATVISEDTSFDEAFPEISFEIEQEEQVREETTEPTLEVPPLPELELEPIEDAPENEPTEEASEADAATLSEEPASFLQTEEATNLTERSIDEILKDLPEVEDEENDGVIDSEELQEFKQLRAEAERSRLAAMAAMDAREAQNKEEKEEADRQKQALKDKSEELFTQDTPEAKAEPAEEKVDSELFSHSEEELPSIDFEVPDYISEKEEEEVPLEVVDRTETDSFDSEEEFFDREEDQETSSETKRTKSPLFDLEEEDSLFSLDDLLAQTFSPVDAVGELEKQPVKEPKDSDTKSIQTEQVSLIDSFIVNQPSLKAQKGETEENEERNDLSEEQLRSLETPVSENLATIMIRQGKYSRALQIYEQLSLKNPHKKAYFAPLIENLKKQID